MRTSPQRVLREPLIRGKSFDKLLAGKEAFGPKEKGGQDSRVSTFPGEALPVSQRKITRPAVRRGVMRKGFRVRTAPRPKLPD